MFENLEIFRIAHGMARHAGQRQAVIAQNIANADTPGYKSSDLIPFSDLVSESGSKNGTSFRRTRPSHLHGSSDAGATYLIRDPSPASDPNGNTVTLETEMLKAVEINREHNRALAIYRSSMNILRASIGRR